MNVRRFLMVVSLFIFLVGMSICAGYYAVIWEPYMWRQWGRADDCRVISSQYYQYCDDQWCTEEYLELEVVVGQRVGKACASGSARDSLLGGESKKYLYSFQDCDENWVPQCKQLMPRWLCLPCDDCREVNLSKTSCLFSMQDDNVIVVLSEPYFPLRDFTLTFLLPLFSFVIIPAVVGSMLLMLTKK